MRERKIMFRIALLFLTVLFGACAENKVDSTPKDSGEETVSASTPENSEEETVSASTPENSEEETVSYSVVFKEEGFADVVISVNEGEGIETLPTFQGTPKTGYVLAWDKTELTVITENTVVNAVERAKKYTITFDLAGGSLDVQSLEVTYDAQYTLPTPSYTGFQFVAWYYGEEEISQTGKWEIDGENIVLTAMFESWEGPFLGK